LSHEQCYPIARKQAPTKIHDNPPTPLRIPNISETC
jgi:hypothetical protein